jgi:hypothetical protein
LKNNANFCSESWDTAMLEYWGKRINSFLGDSVVTASFQYSIIPKIDDRSARAQMERGPARS